MHLRSVYLAALKYCMQDQNEHFGPATFQNGKEYGPAPGSLSINGRIAAALKRIEFFPHAAFLFKPGDTFGLRAMPSPA